MISRRWQVTFGMAAALMTLFSLPSLHGQALQELNPCDGQDGATPDQRIDSCSKAISSNNYSGKNLAKIFNNLGSAYASKRLYNFAILDFEYALTLDPDFSEASRNLESAIASRDGTAAVQNKPDRKAPEPTGMQSKPDYGQTPEPTGISQQRFLNLLSGFLDTYRNGKNELQKTATRQTRDHLVCDMLSNPVFNNWVGRLYLSGDNSANGSARIVIEGEGIRVTLHSQKIATSSPLYQTIFNLRSGARVVVSGKLDQSNNRCIRERSLTERGSMEEPEYNFSLSGVAP